MPENSNPPAAAETIQRYRGAQRRLRHARRSVTVLVFAIVAAYAWLLWTTYKDFRDNQIPILTAELSAEATAYLPEVSAQMSAMLNRVFPIYVETLVNRYHQDQEKYLIVLTDEFTELERYAKKSWPRMQDALYQMAMDQERAMSKALQDIVPPGQLQAVTEAYRDALQKRLEELFTSHFEEQIQWGDKIIRNLEKMAQSEPHIPKENTRYILGLFLELLGLQIQVAENGTYDFNP